MAQQQNFNYGGNFINALRAGQQDKQQQQLFQTQQQQIPIQNQFKDRQLSIQEQNASRQDADQKLKGLEWMGKVTNNLLKMPDEILPRAYAGLRPQIEQATGVQLPETTTREELMQYAALVEQEKQKWGAPKAALNAQGQEVFMQGDDAGNFRQIEGFRPAKKQPLVQVNTAERDSEFQKKMASKDADRFAEIENNYQSSLETEDRLKDTEELMQSFQTGRMTPLLAQLSSLYGGDTAQAAQAFEANANQLVLQAAESLKGALSDRDLDLLMNSTISMRNTPEANQRIMSIIRKGIDRKKQQYQGAVQYVDEKGTLRGYRSSEFSQPEQQGQQQPPTAINPQTGQKIQLINGQWVPVNE